MAWAVSPANMLRIDLNNSQTTLSIDGSRLIEAVRTVLLGEGIARGQVSLAIIDAATMHALNRRHLEHDYPTDVLSFLLERDEDALEGEVIASADEALLNAPRFGWSPEAELTLYVVHGTLHLCGYDDLDDDAVAVMREREDHWMTVLGYGPSRRAGASEPLLVEKQP